MKRPAHAASRSDRTCRRSAAKERERLKQQLTEPATPKRFSRRQRCCIGIGNAPLTDDRTRTETIERYPQLNSAQRTVADQIFESQERIVGLDGVAGAGKTTIETSTLQAHLAKGQQADTGEKRFYVLDESSLASTKQMHDFVSRLHPNDRVLSHSKDLPELSIEQQGFGLSL